jgi:ribonuclease Z
MTLYFLGTGAAVSDPHRTTTMLALEQAGHILVIDCGGDVIQRMLAAGLDPAHLDALVLTHEHPDHIAGFPLLVEKLWLLGRERPLPVYGPAPALEVARALFGSFRTDSWEGVPERVWHPVPMEAGAHVVNDGVFEVTASPVVHPVPTIGLRIRAGGTTVTYSADTSQTEAMVELARGADVLIHEATGRLPGVHSSAEEAAATAADAGAHQLILVHLPPGLSDDDLIAARRTFPATTLGEELAAVEIQPQAVAAHG